MAQIEVKDLSKYYRRKISSGTKGSVIRNFFRPEWQTVHAVDGGCVSESSSSARAV
jgi:hypothetical protein